MTDPTGRTPRSRRAAAAITVAVCTRNRRETIDACLSSLLEQDHPRDDYEVVVVDDGSTDGTAQIARRRARDEGPRVRVLTQAHEGLSAARNRAVADSDGHLICFLDDDAIASPGWVAAMASAAQRHPGVDCFGGRLLLRLEGRPPRTCGRESLGAALDMGAEEQPVERVKGSNMAIRRSAFERIGPFNPALVWRGDEDNWTHRLHGAGGRAMYVPDALVWHRRLASDLRLRSLLRARFGWGVGQVQYKRETGIAFRPRPELRELRRELAHAVRDRCTGGLLQAAIKAGALWAAATGELRRTPTAAAPAPGPAQPRT